MMNGDDHLRPRGVSEVRPVGVRDLFVVVAGKENLPGRQYLGEILRDGQVQVCLCKPAVPRANVSSVPPAVSGVHDDSAGEEVFREVAAALVRYLMGT